MVPSIRAIFYLFFHLKQSNCCSFREIGEGFDAPRGLHLDSSYYVAGVFCDMSSGCCIPVCVTLGIVK